MWRSHSASCPACFTNAAERASSSTVHPAMMPSTFLPLISDGACQDNCKCITPLASWPIHRLELYDLPKSPPGTHHARRTTSCKQIAGRGSVSVLKEHAEQHDRPTWGCTAAAAGAADAGAVVSASSPPEAGALAAGAAEAAAASLAAAGGANRLSVGAAAVEAAGAEAKLNPARRGFEESAPRCPISCIPVTAHTQTRYSGEYDVQHKCRNSAEPSTSVAQVCCTWRARGSRRQCGRGGAAAADGRCDGPRRQGQCWCRRCGRHNCRCCGHTKIDC